MTARGEQLRSFLPGRNAWIDLAFSAVLVGLALVGFSTGFLGWQWILAAGAGLILGLLVAHIGAVRRWPALLTFVVLALVYLILGGPLAVRDDLIGGVIPSLTTLHDLAVGAATGWKKWLTLLPPVDATGALMAIPWLTGLAGAALTYGVARRWRAAPVVVVAPLVLLATSFALGTRQPAAKLLQGVVFALVLIGWVAVRSARQRSSLQNGAGRNARLATGVGLFALAALAGTFVGPHLPGQSPDQVRQVVRSTLTPPYDVAQFASPLAGFRRYTEPNPAKLFDEQIMTVTGLPSGTPVQFATLDNYNGLVWGAADRSENGVPFQQVGSRIAPRTSGKTVTATITVDGDRYAGTWLPIAGSPTGVAFEGANKDAYAKELWLNTDTNTGVVASGMRAGAKYALTTILPSTAPTDKLPASLPVAIGANAPEDSTFIDAKLDAWTGQASGAWPKFVSVARYMSSNGAYTDGGEANSNEKVYLPGHGLSRLGRFVGSSQLAGNDEQYAAALALAGQRLGIPSRVVMGAFPEAGGVVKGKDVRAWVQVQKDDGSWFDVLPQTFVPDRNKKPNEQQLKSEEQRVGAQVPPPAGTNPPSVLQGPDQAQNATDLNKRKKNPLNPFEWPLWLQLLIFAVLVPLLVLAAVYFLIRWLKARRRRRHASEGPTPLRVAWVWRDLVADARTMGLRVEKKATRLEQAESFPEPARAIPLAAQANAHVFGPGEPDEQVSLDLLTEADDLRSQLRAELGWWRRVRSDVSLRPFFDRRRSSTPRRLRLPALTRRKVATS